MAMNSVKIACPKCQWQPDGRSHWQCSCGHCWNTFETKGECPKCKIQWQDTHCPACHESSAHGDWYTNEIVKEQPLNFKELNYRKARIEEKLIGYGLTDIKITYLRYLDFYPDEFQTPYEVGCRILILWAVSYVAANLEEKNEVAEWLKTWDLWDKVSDNEKKLFAEELPERTLVDFSWHIEAVIVLCWALNLLENLPDLDTEISNDDLDALTAKLPIGENPEVFLSLLAYRNKEEIFIENIINEMITSHLRDRMIHKEESALTASPVISFERHVALNWVRKFGEISDWDDTDTST